MRCFQLSLLCILWRKQARLVSLSGDAAERIEWLFSVENIIRILRVRRPFFPTECQPFPSCYRCSNKRQRCLKSHLGLNWIRAEPVKPRRCLEAELCFAVTLTGSWAKEQKGHPSKPLGWRLKSKPLPRQQASSRDWMLKNTCMLFFFFLYACLCDHCLCAFGCFFGLYGVPQSVLKCLHTSWCWSGRIRQEVTTISHHETPVSASHLEMESSWNCGMCRKSVWKCNIVVFYFFYFVMCVLILYFSEVLRNKEYLKTTPSLRVEISPDVQII